MAPQTGVQLLLSSAGKGYLKQAHTVKFESRSSHNYSAIKEGDTFTAEIKVENYKEPNL